MSEVRGPIDIVVPEAQVEIERLRNPEELERLVGVEPGWALVIRRLYERRDEQGDVSNEEINRYVEHVIEDRVRTGNNDMVRRLFEGGALQRPVVDYAPLLLDLNHRLIAEQDYRMARYMVTEIVDAFPELIEIWQRHADTLAMPPAPSPAEPSAQVEAAPKTEWKPDQPIIIPTDESMAMVQQALQRIPATEFRTKMLEMYPDYPIAELVSDLEDPRMGGIAITEFLELYNLDEGLPFIEFK